MTMKWEQLPDVLQVSDVAQAINISERTTRKLFINGTIKAVKCGKKWLCAKENLMAYVKGE